MNHAKKSIYIQCYSFTSRPIAAALIQAHKKGVGVFVITDKSQLFSKHSRIISLYKSGIPVVVDHKVAIAHNKVMIIDQKIVLTGSYNWTDAAEKRNAENLFIIYENKKIIDLYIKNWKMRYRESKPFDGMLLSKSA